MFNTLFTALQAIPADSLKEPAAIIDQTIRTIIETPADKLIANGLDYAVKFGIKVLSAFLIYIIGAWLIKKIKALLKKIFIKRAVDESLSTFLLSVISITLTVLLLITTISVLGIDTTSFVALLAGSGLAIGMALSGTLQNFAGGIMILVFKPFKVGDYIEAQGFSGTVKSIEITTIHLSTPDNKIIILPNGALSNGTINNYSTTGLRRCDWTISVAYGSNVEQVKEELLNIVKSHPATLNEPAEPFVALAELAESSIKFTLRAWVSSENYWDLFFNVNEKIYNNLPKAGISFPFPQLDVNIKNR